MPRRTPLLFILWMLLFALPAEAKLTIGVVTDHNGLLRSEKQANALADYLAEQLGEPVAVQTFATEKNLHDWLSRYRLVDVAVLDEHFLASQRPGEVFPLADYVADRSPQQPSSDLIVARQGLNPGELQKVQKILFSMSETPAGRKLLNQLQVLAIVPPGLSAAELADRLPKVAEPPPTPEPAPTVAVTEEPPSEPMVTAAPVALPTPPKVEPVEVTPPPPVKPVEPVPPTVAEPTPPAKQPAPPPPREALMAIAGNTQDADNAPAGKQASYRVEQVADRVYAALARPGGGATSNAFFVIAPEYVVAGGAHMTKQAIDDLVTAIHSVTDKPLRYFILAHHHTGYNSIDFDFPPDVDLIISWQTWKAMDEEIRAVNRPILFFSDGLTLKLGDQTIILTNMGQAHTEGDTLVFIPEPEILFTSDLVYVDSVGYMGDGHMEDWLLALEFIERLGAKKIIPGYGPVSSNAAIAHFKDFFRDMVTEVLKHLERGDDLEETVRTFSLPEYRDNKGYQQFIRGNVSRAYRDLKENVLN